MLPLSGRLLLGRIGLAAVSLAASQAITGIMFLVAARTSGAAEFGAVASAVAICVISVIIFDFGLNNYITREVAARQLSLESVYSMTAAKRLLLPIILPAPLLGVFAIDSRLDSWMIFLLLAGIAWFLWESQSSAALLRAQELFSRAALAQVIGRSLGLTAVALLISDADPIAVLLTGVMIGYFAEWLIALFVARMKCARPSFVHLYLQQREASGYGLSSLSASAQQLDTPVVSLGGGDVAAGVYAAAGRLLGPLGMLSTALASVATPWLARSRSEGEQQLRFQERRVVRLATVIAVLPLLFSLIGGPLLSRFLGPEYEASGTTLVLLAIGTVMSTLNQATAVMLQNRGCQNLVAIIVGISLVVGLIASWALAAVGGAPFAAAGYVLSQLIILTVLSRSLAQRRRKVAYR